MSELTLGYLDVMTVGGPQQQVADDVHRIQTMGESVGLHLNVSNCEFICAPESCQLMMTFLSLFKGNE